jgi:hypothetical protein
MKKQDQGDQATDIRPQNSPAQDWKRIAQEKKALGPMKALKDKNEFLKVRCHDSDLRFLLHQGSSLSDTLRQI